MDGTFGNAASRVSLQAYLDHAKWFDMTTGQCWAKKLQVLLLAVTALGVGMYVGDFSGRRAAWVALVCLTIAMAGTAFQLINDFWRSRRRSAT